MRWLRWIAIALLIIAAGVALGGMLGLLLAGEFGLSLGVVGGLVFGLQLAVRFILDRQAIHKARKNATQHLSRQAMADESRRMQARAYEESILSRRLGLAYLMRRQRRLSDSHQQSRFDPDRGRYVPGRSSGAHQHHDLELPRIPGKRKGKPKRQRFG